ncbi:uncharacterized protein C7orf50 homolog isoform X2 [Sapajus apella]|uniref:Uncharacterized protein C7orf50 homolog isoform X2 n=1 Tax=Sapajus apella TaxID=9515 RepID=A0A6J3GCN8_SAPAP|nr:uncharacterized protein C7orf50 homolog isoform X2 [Sapajus apella]
MWMVAGVTSWSPQGLAAPGSNALCRPLLLLIRGEVDRRETWAFLGGAVLRTVQDAEPELSPEEQSVLERKLKKKRKKKERQRLREAGVVAQQPPARRSGAELALDYLCRWAQKHENWRFQKTRQTWLLLHMYDSDKVPDEHFSTLLAYLEGLRGQARELTVQKAEALMRELDEDGVGGPNPLLPGRAQRIRQVLQLLS